MPHRTTPLSALDLSDKAAEVLAHLELANVEDLEAVTRDDYFMAAIELGHEHRTSWEHFFQLTNALTSYDVNLAPPIRFTDFGQFRTAILRAARYFRYKVRESARGVTIKFREGAQVTYWPAQSGQEPLTDFRCEQDADMNWLAPAEYQLRRRAAELVGLATPSADHN